MLVLVLLASGQPPVRGGAKPGVRGLKRSTRVGSYVYLLIVDIFDWLPLYVLMSDWLPLYVLMLDWLPLYVLMSDWLILINCDSILYG